MAVLIADSFTAADNTDIEGRTPDTTTAGATWDEVIGNWQILSNKATKVAAADRGVVIINCGQSTGIRISCKARSTVANTSLDRYTGLAIRRSDNNNFWMVGINAQSNLLAIIERNAGTNTIRASTSVPIDIATEYDLEVELDDQTITAWLNGANETSWGSATLNETSTSHGILAYSTNDTVDDFEIETLVDEFIDGSTAGTCTVTGILEGKGYVSSSIVGVATQIADIKGRIGIAGSIAGTSNVTGDAVAVVGAVGLVSGTSTVTGTLQATGTLVGSIAGTSTVTGDLKFVEEIEGSTSGISVVSGTLAAIGYLVASVAGTSIVSGDIQAEQSVEGEISGTSSVTGTLVAIGYLLGAITGTAVVSGDIQAETEISGTASGTSTVTGDIKSIQDISSSISGSVTVSGTLFGKGYLNGEAQGTSVALMSVGGFILASASGLATVSGTLVGTGYLEGSSAGTSTVEGILEEAEQEENLISGIAVGTSSVDGYLVGVVRIQGTTSGTVQVAGQLHGKINIFGVTSGQVTVNGIISGNVYISGISQGAGNQSGSLWAKGYLVASVLGLSTASLFVEGEIVGEGTPMLSAGVWKKNQPNTILFVLTDAAGAEVTGLGDTFTLELSKAGAAFQVGVGTKSEVGSGWYKYVSTASEANTSGPIALTVTGSGIVQQNLEYVVEDRVVTAIEFTYTLLSSVGSLPIAGANVNFSVNSNPANSVWSGITDSFGVAKDLFGNLPRLSPGNYFIFSDKPGFVFEMDQETVS